MPQLKSSGAFVTKRVVTSGAVDAEHQLALSGVFPERKFGWFDKSRRQSIEYVEIR